MARLQRYENSTYVHRQLTAAITIICVLHTKCRGFSIDISHCTSMLTFLSDRNGEETELPLDLPSIIGHKLI